MGMSIGFIFFIAVYSLLCFYMGYNGWKWLKAAFSFKWKKTYIILFIFLSSAYIISFLFSSRTLQMIGGYWLVIFGYCCVLLPLVNLVYFLTKKNQKWKVRSGYVLVAFFSFVLIYGSFNAWSPVVRDYSVELNNPDKEPQGEELKLLIAADLHLGEVIGVRHLERFIDVVNNEQPDIVLLSGDIIDNSISPYFTNNLSDILQEIDVPLGVYAVPGNHDYYGGDLYLLRDEFKEIGFNFLMDEIETVQDQLTIIGRKDYTDKERQSIEELMSDADKQLPVIMLDHQPREISEAHEHGVDMIISGHTHRGQVFPANFITSAMYENDWGHLQKDQLHSFTTSGFGFWGPAVRIGSRSEVMTVTFTY
ncbi:metallophosphoesterase [Alkalicoccobacillus porphyridii]|uniref:Metallophosphoesterase n=1 Tax=Alkalicoccobacillus porphyridii TaxID=2597270 RepID=A0A553ZWA6_9BACI|nr:metallophosphoesterase [Alkalicoccobacillus porphyridii]TSB45712.1 metallophosphoesterase [Alkalicoccobacillus porphyridii]